MSVNFNALAASDGSGEPARATVTAVRPIGSTSIIVNATTNWPTGPFIATTGTLQASGTLAPATVQVFYGTASATTVTITSFAAGYTDQGNAIGDVVVIKPTTEWANIVGGVLGAGGITGAQIANGTINFSNLLSTIFSGQVQSYSQTGPGAGTGYYLNLGGIKLCWGITTTIPNIGPNSSTSTELLNFPSGFFSTLLTSIVTLSTVGDAVQQYVTGVAAGTVGQYWAITNTSSTTTSAQLSWFAIGT